MYTKSFSLCPPNNTENDIWHHVLNTYRKPSLVNIETCTARN